MVLTGTQNEFELVKPVFFIGFMGSGKTSVTRHLSEHHGFDSIDADDYLVQQEGRSIADIFEADGESHFRDLETRYLRELAQGSPKLVSCGGGVVTRPENVHIMRDSGFVVYLHTTAEESSARIPDSSTRPLFKDLNNARDLLAQREPSYIEAADVQIDTVGRSVPDIAAETLGALRGAGVVTAR